jgi:hypothetical protein
VHVIGTISRSAHLVCKGCITNHAYHKSEENDSIEACEWDCFD